MSSAGSVTHWISRLKAGDHAAVQPLWEAYFSRLVDLASAKLRGAPRRVADEEDVALSALDSFCRGAAQGRFPLLSDRDNLWQLLVVITARKAVALMRREARLKRGGGRARVGPRPPRADADAEESALAEVMGSEPTPAFAALAAEVCQRRLDSLGDADLRAVALLKMESYTNAEIAQKLGWVTRTVERKLRLIRRIWERAKSP
jgi:DNA-directed RNA polymerase specialized sigma24 family protein